MRRFRRTAAIMPLIAVLLPVLMILASFVVNTAYMELTRTELRIAVDSATRAAGNRFIRTGEESVARAAAREAGTRNHVSSSPLLFADDSIEFGTSQRASEQNRYEFSLGGIRPNGVRVTGLRTSASNNGAVAMVFPTFGAVSSFEPTQMSISTQAELDIALVLDRSGSMAYAVDEDTGLAYSNNLPPRDAPSWRRCDPAPETSRWYDLVYATDVFFEELENTPVVERVSLSTYSSSAKHEADLSTDYSLIRSVQDDYTNEFCGGATNIGDGIGKGHDALTDSSTSRSWVAKVMIVMTDGIHNTGSDPVSAAQVAFQDGVMVFSITFSNEADQARMQQVAAVGGGKHFHAESREALADVFREIVKSLPTLLTQ